MADFVSEWIAKSGYTAALGVALESVDAESALLRLPFGEQNCNPGKALHGGCAASLAVTGAHAVTRAVLGAESGPWHTAALQVTFDNVAAGSHTVLVAMAGANHVSVAPPLSAQVTFTAQ